MRGTLYYGDCLTVMQDMNLGSVDLIYLDPPFNSNRSYNAIYKDATGRPLPDQIDAFCDMWTLDEEREEVIRFMPVLLRQAGVDDSAARLWQLWMNALRGTQPRLLAYLSYMTERLVQMKPLLKPTGSVYLHCDPTASHYIKVIMDAIFGHDNFKNEIIWRRTNAHPLSIRKFESITDTILYYSRGHRFVFNGDRSPMSEKQVEALYDKIDAKGRFTTTDLSGGKAGGKDAYKPFKSIRPPAGRAWAPPQLSKLPQWAQDSLRPDYSNLGQLEKCHALDEIGLIYWTRNGKPRLKRYLEDEPTQWVPNLWTDITPAGKEERLGYATQKPLALLERIIRASTNEGDTVLDPFCGCATTLEAAHNLNRKWIGIDIAYHAIKHVVMPRLQERLILYEGADFVVRGEPRTFEAAQDLWTRDKYHFQSWAISVVDGLPTNKRTADGGIDGRLHFASPNVTSEQSMAIEVKGGKNVSIRDLRALRGVLEADEAWMAGLIILHPLGTVKERNFRKFMAQAGQVDVFGMQYPRMQMLTVQDLLDGKRFHAPSGVVRGSRQGVLLSPLTYSANESI